jgi:hypothetical protein
MTSQDIKKTTMLQALVKKLGIVTEAAKDAGISRNTHYEWLKHDPEYKQQVDDLDNITLDFVEGALHSKIKDGDTTAIIFFLKTKGKRRGYIEKQTIDLNNSMSTKPTIIIGKVENEEMDGVIGEV